MRQIAWVGLSIMGLFSANSWGDLAPLLPAQSAFPFQVQSNTQGQAELSWQVPEHYYLYQQSIEVKQDSKPLVLDLPEAEPIDDEYFGQTQVYLKDLNFIIPTQANQQYQVTWQGCAKDRICYPPQSIEFKTDQFGLVQSHQPTKNLIDVSQQATAPSALDTVDLLTEKSSAEDLKWSDTLAERSFAYGLLLFLGLGILLAFTPCSLPMLPILSSLLLRQQKGIKAWMISLTFIVSMASIYAILGLVAASAGLNFQRWLQQPATLIGFSLLFVIFACNLFGWFDLRLPQRWVNRLDQIQGSQRGGTLLGAAAMGMISALLVGPCMTAPLAGALLFISQTQSQVQGALLLFSLGLGMGLPLFIASILGANFLPKAGMWMHQIRVIFAFIMLGLALYFIRPLLHYGLFHLLATLLASGVILYAGVRAWQFNTRFRILYLGSLVVAMVTMLYVQYQTYQQYQIQKIDSNLSWMTVRNDVELQQILATAAKDQAIVIDVYADWCIACQPIEHQILKSAAVQQALSNYTLIKLDLSRYDERHQKMLNDLEILGPPTYLFLDQNHQEIRDLRLTGAFSEATLLKQLAAFKQRVD